MTDPFDKGYEWIERIAGAGLDLLNAVRGEDAQNRILKALDDAGPMTPKQLTDVTGMWTATFYPAIFQLEQAGKVTSAWVPGDYPRQRLYQLAPIQPDPADPEDVVEPI